MCINSYHYPPAGVYSAVSDESRVSLCEQVGTNESRNQCDARVAAFSFLTPGRHPSLRDGIHNASDAPCDYPFPLFFGEWCDCYPFCLLPRLSDCHWVKRSGESDTTLWQAFLLMRRYLLEQFSVLTFRSHATIGLVNWDQIQFYHANHSVISLSHLPIFCNQFFSGRSDRQGGQAHRHRDRFQPALAPRQRHPG